MVTRLGALLDTVADLMFNFFVIAVAVKMDVWPIWVLYLWGFRDLGVLSMRASAAQLGFDIPSSYLGKVASNFIFYALFLMPFDYALNNSNYMHHAFVAEHIHPYIGTGLHWLAFGAVLVGIAMQWIAAFQYGRVYIHKYDEIHKAEEQANSQLANAIDNPQDDATNSNRTGEPNSPDVDDSSVNAE